MSARQEPAIRGYFFGKGYDDLWDTIKDNFRRNWKSAKEDFARAKELALHKDKAKKRDWFWPVVVGVWIAAGISTLIFGSAFSLVASLVHVVLLVLLFSLVYIGFTAVWLVERLYMRIRSLFVKCPHCYEKSHIPEYRCGRCGKIHAQLYPNSYGILKHQCKCGERLASTFWGGRGKLKARCPKCYKDIGGQHVESKGIFIPIIGGPSAGKSSFMFGAIRQLVQHKAKELGFTSELKEKSQRDYKHSLRQLKSGRPLEKTRDPTPAAFNLLLKRKREQSTLLYLYDPAGEAYEEQDRLAAHRFYEYLSGMILIVDPFSFPFVQKRYSDELKRDRAGLKPSKIKTEHEVNRVINNLQQNFGLQITGKVEEPLAVVLNKVDAFDLEELIGESAVDREMAKSAGQGQDRDTVRNELIQRQLIAWDEAGLVNLIEQRFSKVQYYSCSALGRMADKRRTEFKAKDVLPPLLWICEQVDSRFVGRLKATRPRMFLYRDRRGQVLGGLCVAETLVSGYSVPLGGMPSGVEMGFRVLACYGDREDRSRILRA